MDRDYRQNCEQGNRDTRSRAKRLKIIVTRAFHRIKRHPSQTVRGSIALGLIVGGLLGPFLPILGLWMLPLGLVLLVAHRPEYWRLRRRYVRWRRARRLRVPPAH
jgi:hypothetical protein